MNSNSWRRLVPIATLLLLVASCASGPRVHQDAGVGGVVQGVVLLPEGRTLSVQSSLKIQPDSYLRRPVGQEGREGVIRLDGLSDVVLDLTGVELFGTARSTEPDRATGYGIVVTGCNNVTIRGGRLGGYKGCLVIEDSDQVTVEDVSFDGWHCQRLSSTVVAEDPADWLEPRYNEAGQWLDSYGAAISISDSTRITVKGCVGRGGQNGILLTRSGGCEVYDNDFSFLSGWGLAMFRSSRNTISHNRFDYCVRGYSHDQYWSAQDSAGILIYERSSDNAVVHNSATHCGNGVLIFGGLDLVEGRAFERGEVDAGGCDGNEIYDNDLSFAVGSSLAVAFSGENHIVQNVLSGSRQFGLWSAYSKDLVVLRNEIRDTLGGGISLEHSQGCFVLENELSNNDIGVELWWDNATEYAEGPFGQHRETSSHGHWVVANRFDDNLQDLVIKQTTEVFLRDNSFRGASREVYVDGLASAGREPDAEQGETLVSWILGTAGSHPSGHLAAATLLPPETDAARAVERGVYTPPEVPGSRAVRVDEGGGQRQALESIILGEWGPWDFESGAPRPRQRKPGGALAGATWDTAWFRWDMTVDPRGDIEAWRALKFQPIARAEVDAWVSPWSSAALREEIGPEYFGLIGRAEVQIRASGRYRLKVVSDDGVRVRIDDEVVLENWTWHPSRLDEVEVTLKQGRHTFEVEYFQIDGSAALSMDLEAL